ncbi:MAG: glycoside hydrolase family 31 protein [Eubacteriales bacterium]|nr:glycoside hydrolase family 31 protein [Eubacteriales bacterium]
MLNRHLTVKTFPVADENNVVLWRDYRVTVLADRLFRVEKSKNKIFRDEATQCVWYRNMPPQSFSVTEEKEQIRIKTKKSELILTPREKDCAVIIDGKKRKISNAQNLLGTARTLDKCDGDNCHYDLFGINPEAFYKVKLGTGVCSKTGVAYFDDASSLSLDADGKVKTECGFGSDKYVFAYANNYRDAVKALYTVCGFTPLVPRFALGNWFSRYHAYSQDEYLRLLQRFEDRKIPLTVATLDMDWHWSKTLDKVKKITELGRDTDFYGGKNGWTGYSWNTDLFPDYRQLLKEIKKKNCKITLNLHPASGIRWFENQYNDMAKALGKDSTTGEVIPFNITNDNFINAYFKILHKPYEKDGVDFWWIDWQQGTKSEIDGLDPLWSLNHYHYLDNAKNHNNPLILSRYAGIGSHRYPLGFSGDTFMTWRTLRYLPYFTFTASNIGYSWWSHDIGGHLMGETNGELYLRHIQFGVFSPINRLHSWDDSSMTKEPWVYKNGCGEIIADWLRLRHSMIPFLYSCSMKTHSKGTALLEPLYYEWDEEGAYKEKCGYIFGEELLVYPITEPKGKDGYAKTKVWLPEGKWTDIFTGDEYTIEKGGEYRILLRNLESIPVLAKQGAILPLSRDDGNGISNPTALEIRVFNGNGSFELFEDDREYGKEDEFITTFTSVADTATQTLTIKGAGNKSVIPQNRRMRIKFEGVQNGEITVSKNGRKLEVNKIYEDCACVEFIFDATAEYVLKSSPVHKSEIEKLKDRAKKILLSLESDYKTKQKIYKMIDKTQNISEYKSAVINLPIPEAFKQRMNETLGFSQ